MRAIALDTNTYAGFKCGDRACLEVIQQADRLLLSLRLFPDSPRVAVCASTIAIANSMH